MCIRDSSARSFLSKSSKVMNSSPSHRKISSRACKPTKDVREVARKKHVMDCEIDGMGRKVRKTEKEMVGSANAGPMERPEKHAYTYTTHEIKEGKGRSEGERVAHNVLKACGCIRSAERRRSIILPTPRGGRQPRSVSRSGCRVVGRKTQICLLYTSPSPRDRTRSRMPSSA